jgi:hypothetical protein
MKKRHLFIGVVIGLSALALTLAAIYEPTRIVRGLVLREPFFRGLPASYWRDEIRVDGEAGRVKETTIDTFGDLDAVPVLRRCLRDRDPNVRWPSVLLFQHAGFIEDVEPALRNALDDPDIGVQIQGIRGLTRLRRESLAAIPRLQELAHAADVSVRSNAHYALWEIDQNAALTAGAWATFASDEWQFSVELPGKPEVESTSLETMYGSAPMHEFSIPFGAAYCIVAVTEYDPQVTRDFSVDERYGMAAEGLAENLGGALAQDESIQQSGLIGREHVVEVKGKATLHTRIFLVGDRSYQINITYPPGFVSPNAVSHYLDSLRIDYRPNEEE